jgi:FAD/FMN-containing dehydrogenase
MGSPWCKFSLAVLVAALFVAAGVQTWWALAPIYFQPFHTPFNLQSSEGTVTTFCNFDRRQCCNGTLHFPSTVEHVQELVRGAQAAKQKVRVVGAGHSMSPLVCGGLGAHTADGVLLLSLDKLNKILAVDRGAGFVAVEAGKRLKDLNRALSSLDLSLHNMGLIDEQSVGGLTATGVHGSGEAFGSVSTAVLAMDIVASNGTVVTLSAASHGDVFRYARLHLGIFGVVVRVTLAVRPQVFLRRDHQYVPMATFLADFDSYVSQSRHFQAWWVTYTDQVQLNNITEVTADEAATLQRSDWHVWLEKAFTDVAFLLMAGISRRVAGLEAFIFRLLPWVMRPTTFGGSAREVLTYPGINYHSVRYTEMEIFVPRSRAVEAIRLAEQFTHERRDHCPVNAFHPIRTVRADDIPHSPMFGVDCVAISFVMVDRHEPFDRCAVELEQALIALGGRPHWGKRHTLDHSRAVDMYGSDALSGLMNAAAALDPDGTFMTPHAAKIFSDTCSSTASATRCSSSP